MDHFDNPSPNNWIKEEIECIADTAGFLTDKGNCLAVAFQDFCSLLLFGARLIYDAAGDTQARTLMTLLKSAKIQEVKGQYILYFPGILLTDFS